MNTQPPPNWLGPLSGGLLLLFVGLLALVVAESFGVGVVACLAGVALAVYGLAKRDRYIRYGR